MSKQAQNQPNSNETDIKTAQTPHSAQQPSNPDQPTNPGRPNEPGPLNEPVQPAPPEQSDPPAAANPDFTAESASSPAGEESPRDPSQPDSSGQAATTSQAENDSQLDWEAHALGLQAQLEQLKDDLARARAEAYNIQQEYTAYVKRSKSEAGLIKLRGQKDVLEVLLSVLDDIDAARQAGDLEGPFAAIANKMENTLETNFQLLRYGQVGEHFDPELHEALLAQESETVQEPEIAKILQPGYKLENEILRATKVIVNNPV